MIELHSIESPKPSALESAAERSAETKPIVLPGTSGKATGEPSRSARHLLAAGRTDTRLRAAGTSSLETVIGADNRVRIFDTDLAPWRMVCALEISAPNGVSFIGTGWFAGPRTIVTAGHCVFDNVEMGGWATSIRVSPGRNGQEFPFPRVTSSRLSANDRWVESRDPDFDIGCIHLDQSVGDDTGAFSVAAFSVPALQGFLLNIAGYPGDRGNGEELYFHRNRVLQVSDRRIFYDVDTFGGQSGAPVWIHETPGAAPVVVGIHAYGTGGTPTNLNITANSAPRIIPEVIELIRGWIAADSGT